MKKLCLAALATFSLLGCSDPKEDETVAKPARGVTDTDIKLGGSHYLSGVFAPSPPPSSPLPHDMFAASTPPARAPRRTPPPHPASNHNNTSSNDRPFYIFKLF